MAGEQAREKIQRRDGDKALVFLPLACNALHLIWDDSIGMLLPIAPISSRYQIFDTAQIPSLHSLEMFNRAYASREIMRFINRLAFI